MPAKIISSAYWNLLMMSTRKYFCPHCDVYVSKTQYFKHKNVYYNRTTKTWSTTRLPPSTVYGIEGDFVFGDDSGSSDMSEAGNDDSTVDIDAADAVEGNILYMNYFLSQNYTVKWGCSQ